MAGMSLRLARSPVTPKITRAQGPAMCGSRLSVLSRRGFTQSDAAAESLTGSALLGCCAELLGGCVEQLVPGHLELVDALSLEDLEHVRKIDADCSELIEDRL